MSIKVIINCEKNDSVDYKAGGPLFLGFDFYVKTDKMVEFIRKTLNKYNCPVLSFDTKDSEIKAQWTKPLIDKEIKNYAISNNWYKNKK